MTTRVRTSRWWSNRRYRARTAVGGLPRRQQEGEWSALPIGDGMDFGVSTASVDADRRVVRPPFPPAAERWAFTCVLSISNSVGGPPSAVQGGDKTSHWNAGIVLSGAA